jgi:hypothetical protein
MISDLLQRLAEQQAAITAAQAALRRLVELGLDGALGAPEAPQSAICAAPGARRLSRCRRLEGSGAGTAQTCAVVGPRSIGSGRGVPSRRLRRPGRRRSRSWIRPRKTASHQR